MENKERIQEKIAALQEQWKLLNEKLSTLKRRRTLETDASERFSLDKNIAEAETEHDQIEQKLSELEAKLPAETEEKKGQPHPIEFVNRTKELQFITNIYCPPYLLISAPAGYGKTRLVENVKGQLQKDWLCIHLKFSREKPYSINELTRIILSQLGGTPNIDVSTPEKAGDTIQRCIRETLKQGQEGILLLVDEAEALHEQVAKQLLNQCIPIIADGLMTAKPPVRFRVIVTGRYLSHWKQWSEMPPLEVMPLTSFDFVAVHKTVENFDKISKMKASHEYKPDFAAYLMHFTGGHPGCMVNILQKDYGSTIEMIVSNEEESYKAVVKHAVDKIRDDIPRGLKKIFDTLSVTRRFNPRLLRCFIDTGLIKWSKTEFELEDRLLKTHLIAREKSSFLKDDITRRLLAIRLRRSSLNYFIKVCMKSISFYTERLKNTTSRYRPELIAIELLFQKLQLFYKQFESKEQFFKNLVDTLNLLITGCDLHDALEIISSFIEHLREDWEFRFTINYFFKDKHYNEEYPFNELIEIINNFRKELQGGDRNA